MDATICIATYGDRAWADLATERALPSAIAQGVSVIHKHGTTLHDARNAALRSVVTEWVIYLDADDELASGYVAAMEPALFDVQAPIVHFVDPKGRTRYWRPHVYGHDHLCTVDCLPEGNWIVIGAAVRADLIREVGGWRDFPWSEDWDLWLRCRAAGASFGWVLDAVYRAHVRPDSRNRAPDQAAKLAAHEAIHRANFPELYA